MKTRKPIKPGSTLKNMAHNAKVRADVADAKAKHTARLLDLADRSREALLVVDPALRAARLDRVSHQRAEEDRRHQTALEKLPAKFKL